MVGVEPTSVGLAATMLPLQSHSHILTDILPAYLEFYVTYIRLCLIILAMNRVLSRGSLTTLTTVEPSASTQML